MNNFAQIKVFVTFICFFLIVVKLITKISCFAQPFVIELTIILCKTNLSTMRIKKGYRYKR